MPPYQRSVSRLEAGLFIILVGLQAIVFLYLCLDFRLPVTHDGLHVYALQYYFFNNAAVTREVPQWIPFLTHGAPALWWHFIQSGCGLLANALFPIAPDIRWINYHNIFCLGIFIDELLLLVGMWLWTRRFVYSPAAIFFVCVSVMGSSICATQPYFNLLHYYAIPLMLHLFHCFMDERRWRYVFWVVSLFLLQLVTSDAYALASAGLAVGTYFIFYFFCRDHRTGRAVQVPLRVGPSFYIYVILSAAALGTFYFIFRAALDPQLLNFNPGRGPNGVVPLGTFMSYCTGSQFMEWRDLVLRFSPGMDYTLFLGFLTIPCLVTAVLFCIRRPHMHIVLTVVLLLLASKGGVVSKVLYHVWPGMAYYRHLSLLAPTVKIFLCLLSGIGFDYLLSRKSSQAASLLRFVWAAAGIGLIGLSLYLYVNSDYIPFLSKIARGFRDRNLLLFLRPFESFDMVVRHFQLNAQICLIAAGIALAVAFLLRGSVPRVLLILFVLFHAADMYHYKLLEYHQRTMSLPADKRHVLAFRDALYSPYRGRIVPEIADRIAVEDYVYKLNCSCYGTMYAFYFYDPLIFDFITCNWLAPYNRFLKPFYGQPISEDAVPAKAFDTTSRLLSFPMENPAALKYAGGSEPKIQFFKAAHVLPDEEVGRRMGDRAFTGDVLYLAPALGGEVQEKDLRPLPPDAVERLRLRYHVERYSANHITINVQRSTEGAWLYYSDVWHPGWKARVNGRTVPVRRAALAYKAVPIPAGASRVEFDFDIPYVALMQSVVSALAAAAILLLFFLAGWIARPAFKGSRTNQ